MSGDGLSKVGSRWNGTNKRQSLPEFDPAEWAMLEGFDPRSQATASNVSENKRSGELS